MELPEGFVYRPELIPADEEKALIEEIERIQFSEVRMHGVVARRRTAHFGFNYAYGSRQVSEGVAIPMPLLGLRERLREMVAIEPAEFVEVLVTEYRAGAGIGWHRDAPAFGVVAGVSLAGECRMRLRPYAVEERGARAVDVVLEPRSGYVLQGLARTAWQHSIPATKGLRYSVTFRTLRRLVTQR